MDAIDVIKSLQGIKRFVFNFDSKTYLFCNRIMSDGYVFLENSYIDIDGDCELEGKTLECGSIILKSEFLYRILFIKRTYFWRKYLIEKIVLWRYRILQLLTLRRNPMENVLSWITAQIFWLIIVKLSVILLLLTCLRIQQGKELKLNWIRKTYCANFTH